MILDARFSKFVTPLDGDLASVLLRECLSCHQTATCRYRDSGIKGVEQSKIISVNSCRFGILGASKSITCHLQGKKVSCAEFWN